MATWQIGVFGGLAGLACGFLWIISQKLDRILAALDAIERRGGVYRE